VKNWFCVHKFDACNLHRFSDDVVAGMCWKCNKVFTADCGLHLPGSLQCAPSVECPTCKGIGKVHAPKPERPAQPGEAKP
jgi:hypothetical protein